MAVLSINGINELYLRVLAQRAGFDRSSMQIAAMAGPEMVAALARNAIEGFVTAPPVTTQVVQDGAAIRVASGPEGEPPDFVPYAFLLLITRPETCTNRAAVCADMVKALTQAMTVIRDDPQVARAVMQHRFPNLAPSLLDPTLTLLQRATPERAEVTKQDFVTPQNFALAAGFIRPEDRRDGFDDLFTDAFLPR